MPSASKIFEKILRFKIQFLWIIAFSLIAYFLYFSIQHSTSNSHGFASYYTASRLILAGDNPASFYNDDYFSSKVEENLSGIYEIYLVNPPTTTILFLPFAGFDYVTARVLWITLNLLLLSATIILIIIKMKFNKFWLPVLLILIFSFQPLYANITDAQAYIFIFCLMVFVFIGYEMSKNSLPGIITGLILIFKSAGIFLLLLFTLQKKWKLLFCVLAILIFTFIITLPFFGFNSWVVYSDKLLDYNSSPTLSVTAYQSVHSFFHHFFVHYEKWNPDPIFNLPLVGKSLTIIFSMIILGFTIAALVKFKKQDMAFGSFIIAGLILNPAAIDYHYVLILIPIIILLDWLRKNSSLILWLVFAISFILLALSIPYTSSKVTSGIWAVLAYPKLYGAIGLWILTLRISYLSKISETPTYSSIK